MFDSAGRDQTVAALRRRLDALTADVDVRRRTDTTTSAGVLTAPAPLAAVLPGQGLPRGGVVSVQASRSGATSLLLSLLSATQGTWTTVVGLPDLGLAAAAEMGVDLDRLVVIPDPGPDALQILSILADGMDVIATAPLVRLSPARMRVFSGRLRQRGAVLVVAGQWPGADVVLTVREVRWTGLGNGHGRLRDRDLDVVVSGRRVGAPRSVTLGLRATRTAVRVGTGTPRAAEHRELPALPELVADAV